MERLVVEAFSIEPGEVELHHELVRLFVDEQPVRAAMTLTDRRVAIVMPERETTWLRRVLAIARMRRVVYHARLGRDRHRHVVPRPRWSR